MQKSLSAASRFSVRPHKFLPMLLALAGAMAAAQGANAADTTATIACFGSDMALTSASGGRDSVRLCAEVLNFGEISSVPEGRVIFTVDGSPVGSPAGVALKRGQDPRTGQPAGIASASFSGLHFSPGAHTVKARYIPASPRFNPSQSTAANNLQIGTESRLAESGASSGSTFAPARPTPDFSGKDDGKAKATIEPEPTTNRLYGSVEQDFVWFSKSDPRSILITGNAYVSGPNFTGPTVVPTSPGFIGLDTVTGVFHPVSPGNNSGTIFGNSLDTGFHSGQQVMLGYWLDPAKTKGIELSGFYTESASTSFESAGFASVAIPYLNFATGQASAYTVSQPTVSYVNSTSINTTPGVTVHLYNDAITNGATGGANVGLSDRMWGTALKFRQELPQVGSLDEASYTLGVSYQNLTETMGVNSSSVATNSDATTFEPALGLPGSPNHSTLTQTTTNQSDTLTARNQFYGIDGGLRGKTRWGKVWASAEADVALGMMDETLDSSGYTNSTQTTTANPTQPSAIAGIPLTISAGSPVTTTTTTNSGHGLFAPGGHSHDTFAVLPTGTLKLGYDFNKYISLYVGYHVFYISDVIRAGNQLNSVGLSHSGFVGQSVDIGLDIGF